MSRITGVIVALATTAAVLTGSTSGAAPPPAPASAPGAPGVADLPREIEGGVELTLADGDLLRLWAAADYRTVWSRRRDAATGAWGPRLEVLHRKNLFCGDVDARTSGGAVAAMVQCDFYGYAEDQAPVGSQALWSPDAVTWSSYRAGGRGVRRARHLPQRRQRRLVAVRRLRHPHRGRVRGARPGHARPGVHRHRHHHRRRAGLVPLRRQRDPPAVWDGRPDPHG